MEYNKDKILSDNYQCSEKEQTDYLAHSSKCAQQKYSVKKDSVVLSSDLLRYFNILIFESED
jgi:hypothetical protein